MANFFLQKKIRNNFCYLGSQQFQINLTICLNCWLVSDLMENKFCSNDLRESKYGNTVKLKPT